MFFGIPFFVVLTLLFSVGAIWLLHIFPEWYVVNGVGIMVGAGVVTLIGVSFVPVLIIGFMIVAAIYDHWAVNGSKHMLELADTMIGLKLPVLLVAPKSANYSFIDEEDSVMSEPSNESGGMDWDDPVPHLESAKVKKGGSGCSFHGSRVMLFFPECWLYHRSLFLASDRFRKLLSSEALFGVMYSGPINCGPWYIIRWTYGILSSYDTVAMGKPQAGLPLLNGGRY